MLQGLDFSRCATVDCCVKRVDVVLMQADREHNHTCITRKRAMALLDENKVARWHILSDDDKALIIANAVFPDHCDNFYALKMALNPKTFPYIDEETKKSLAVALEKKNHAPIIRIIGL